MNALDPWGGYSTASINLVHGLPIFGATKAGDPNKSRVGANGDYTRWDSRHRMSIPLVIVSRLPWAPPGKPRSPTRCWRLSSLHWAETCSIVASIHRK